MYKRQHLLQACVSEPVKPVLDRVVTFGAGHFYISQSDKGEMVMGGDLDGYNSYAQRGNLPTLQHVLTEGIAMMPFLSKLNMLRTWGGIMDMSMDGSPIIDKPHIEGLYLNLETELHLRLVHVELLEGYLFERNYCNHLNHRP